MFVFVWDFEMRTWHREEGLSGMKLTKKTTLPLEMLQLKKTLLVREKVSDY